jgi:hypothetical protein
MCRTAKYYPSYQKSVRTTPDVNIAIATKAQTGPLNPADVEFSKAQPKHEPGIYRLCVGFR